MANRETEISKIIGLGTKSLHKSHYPELQAKIRELDGQRALYKSILECIPDSIILTDSHGEIIEINKALERTFGYSYSELIGKHVSILYSAEKIPLKNLHVWQETAKFYQKKDGNLLIGSVSYREVYNNSGDMLGKLEIVHDITDTIDILNRKKLVEEQLRKSQKQEALGTLAGGIAHDFNNILSGIIGFAELTELFETTDRVEISYNIKQILNASYRARDLVKQILSFSRIHEGDTLGAKANAIIQEVVRSLQPLQPDNVSIETALSTNMDEVVINPTELHQVVMNLCRNGLDSMKKKGGVLTIRTSLQPNVPLGSQAGDSRTFEKVLLLEICDTGEGIPSEHLDHIFEPYFTTKAPKEGTGFGLAIVHGIIYSHRGSIKVISSPEKGACFQLYIPLMQDSIKHVVAKKVKSQLPRGKGRIILVDDAKEQIELNSIFFTKLGFEVSAFQSSRDALESFSLVPDHYDIVITDQTMPGLTGIDIAKEIRALGSNVAIVICTGNRYSLPPDTISDLKIERVIDKPVRLPDLANVVMDILSKEK